MAKPRLRDDELEALPPEKRRETLKKRAQRERKKLQNAPVAIVRAVDFSVAAPPISEVIDGLLPANAAARKLFAELKHRLQEAGRWSGAATEGTLLTYVKSTVEIQQSETVGRLAPSVITAQKSAAAALKLHDLPPDKIRKGAGRFTEGW